LSTKFHHKNFFCTLIRFKANFLHRIWDSRIQKVGFVYILLNRVMMIIFPNRRKSNLFGIRKSDAQYPFCSCKSRG